MRLLIILSMYFFAVVSRADDTAKADLTAKASMVREAKQKLSQIKVTPTEARYQQFIESVEKLKKEHMNALYIDDNGKETSFYAELNQFIDEALTANSRELKDRLYSADGFLTKHAAEDAPKEAEEGSKDPLGGGFYVRHALSQRYAFTPTGIKYFEELVSGMLENFTSRPETFEKESKTKTDCVNKAWRVMKLSDRLIELIHVRERISSSTMLKVAMIKASYGDVAGVTELKQIVKARGPEADVLKFGGMERSFQELFGNLEKKAKERLEKSPGLASLLGGAASTHIERWAHGGAIGDPVFTEDGHIVVGWRNKESYFHEPFNGPVVLDPATLKPISSLPFDSAGGVYKAGKDKFWVDTSDQRHDTIFVLVEYDKETKQLTRTKVSANLGNQAVFSYATPRWDEKNQTLLFPLFGEPGVAWLHAERGLDQIWHVPNPGKQIGTLLGPPNENIFLKDASSHIFSQPAINPKTGEVVVGSRDGRVFVLNSKAQLVAQFQGNAHIRSVAFLSDGRIVAGSESGTLYWLKQSGQRLEQQYTYQFGNGYFLRLAVLSDDQVVIPARYRDKDGIDDNRITWVRDGKYVKSYTFAVSSVMAIENDDLVLNSPNGWLGCMKSATGEYLHMPLGIRGAVPVGIPVRTPDGGFLVWSEQMGAIFWMTPWEQFKDKILWPTAQQGLVVPF